MLCLGVQIRLFSFLLAVSISLSLPAQSLTNLAGVWNGINFNMPTQLTGTTGSNGAIIDVPQISAFGANTIQVTMQTNGTFSGSGSGTISIDGQGKATVYPSGSAPVSLRINSSQDTFIGASMDNSDVLKNDLSTLVRAPQSLNGSDLAGNWSLVMFDAPQQLIELTATNGALTDLLGMGSNSVFGSTFVRIGSGSMTINSGGTLSGTTGDGPFSGSYTVGNNGEIDITISAGDAFTMPAFVNNSKDVMFALHQDSANNQNEVALIVKNPSTVAPADLKGLWQVTTYSAPSQITSVVDTNGYITNIETVGSFKLMQSAWYVAGYDGFVSGSIEGLPTIGAFSATDNGAATITFTNSLGETQTHTGYLNAGKNCIVLAENDGDSISLSVVTRAPAWPGASQNVGLQSFGVSGLVWAADTNTVLQSSSSLNNGWGDISSTLGKHQYSVNPTNAAQFYRVRFEN